MRWLAVDRLETIVFMGGGRFEKWKGGREEVVSTYG